MPERSGVAVGLAELVEMRHRVLEVQLFSAAGRRSPLIGLHHSRLRGRGVDFDQVRVYQPGDDVRAIDWRVTARTREPHTKLFHEERERPVYLLVEQSPQTFFGTTRQFKATLAAQLAALVGWAVLEHNDRIGGMVFGGERLHEVRPRRSKQNLLRFFDHLVSANRALQDPALAQAERISFSRVLRRAREVLRPGSLALVICDERSLDDATVAHLTLLARHSDLVFLPLSDPLDHALPQAGLLRFSAGAAELELDTDRGDLRTRYAAEAAERRERWTQLSLRLGIPLLPLSTAEDLVEQLRHLLRQHRPGYTS